jgi:transposase
MPRPNKRKAVHKQVSRDNRGKFIKDCCGRKIISLQPDFLAQRSALVEMIEDSGHVCIFFPKFHCELNFIEQYWGAAK